MTMTWPARDNGSQVVVKNATPTVSWPTVSLWFSHKKNNSIMMMEASTTTMRELPADTATTTTTTTTTLVKKIAYRDALGRPGLFSGIMDEDTALEGTLEYNEDEIVLRYTGKLDNAHWKDDAARIVYKTGDLYTGSVRNSCKDGSGIFRWTNGRTYTGDFVLDRRHGKGRYEWPDGQVYTGDFCCNRREGVGEYTTADGRIRYEGHWKNGMYEGAGTYKYPNPETNGTIVYKGEFLKGKPHGTGQEETIHGKTIRHGQWKDGIFVDASTEQLDLVLDQPWFDAQTHVPTIYRGLMNDRRQPHGNGTAIYKSGDIHLYEGCWTNGIYHGQGRLLYTSGEEYIGTFLDGDRHGSGTFKWTDGRQYTGDFVHNQRTGHGVFTWETGDRYDGEFMDGKRSGYGTFVFDNGSYYSGQWKNGVYHGRGKTVDSSGSCYIGEFRNGQRHGQGEEFDALNRVTLSGLWSHGIHQDSPNYVPASNELVVVVSEDDPCSIEQQDNPDRDDKNCSRNDAECQKQEDVTKTMETSASLLVDSRPPPPPVPPPAVPGQQLIRTWQVDTTPPPEFINHDDCMAVVDRKVTDGLGCVGLYTGIVWKKNQQPHGVGRLVYTDGKRIHEGFWQYGNKEGHGRCLFLPQYDFHEGEYRANLRHGPGRYSWKDGRHYVGEYRFDQRHGRGVFTYSNGSRYEGSFDRGQRSGFGRLDFVDEPDGSSGYYEGEWYEGVYHGQGKILYPTWSYEGEWSHGEMHGYGRRMDAAGTLVVKGQWEKGVYVEGSETQQTNGETEETISEALELD